MMYLMMSFCPLGWSTRSNWAVGNVVFLQFCIILTWWQYSGLQLFFHFLWCCHFLKKTNKDAVEKMCCITILVLSGFKQHIYNCFLYKWCLRERHTLENNLKRACKSCWGLGLRIESICEWPEGWWSGGVGPDWPEAPTRGQWGKRVVGGVQMVTCDDPSCLETGGFKDSLQGWQRVVDDFSGQC